MAKRARRSKWLWTCRCNFPGLGNGVVDPRPLYAGDDDDGLWLVPPHHSGPAAGTNPMTETPTAQRKESGSACRAGAQYRDDGRAGDRRLGSGLLDIVVQPSPCVGSLSKAPPYWLWGIAHSHRPALGDEYPEDVSSVVVETGAPISDRVGRTHQSRFGTLVACMGFSRRRRRSVKAVTA